MNCTATFATLVLLLSARFETKTGEGMILDVTPRGFLVQLGSATVGVEDSVATRFWYERASSDRSKFVISQKVGVRIKTDTTPATLREIADLATWRWLDQIRKETMACQLVRADTDRLEVRFEDGTPFTYQLGPRTTIQVKGAEAILSDLVPEQWIYVKGRLTSNLQTQAVSISDVRPKALANERAPTPPKLPAFGVLRGEVVRVLNTSKIFLLEVEGRSYYFTFTPKTLFSQDGKVVKPGAVAKGSQVRVAYRRDSSGRLIATKVELFQAG